MTGEEDIVSLETRFFQLFPGIVHTLVQLGRIRGDKDEVCQQCYPQSTWERLLNLAP